MIQRNPSRVFAALWVAWLVNVWVALAQPDHPSYGLIVLLAFFAIELPATALVMPGNARDTLSEIATWVVRTTSHHRRLRGWNLALIGALILPVSWLLLRSVRHYSGSEPLGLLLGGVTAVFLWDHFVNPDVHG